MTVGVFFVFFVFADWLLEVLEAVVVSQTRQFRGLAAYEKDQKEVCELALVSN